MILTLLVTALTAAAPAPQLKLAVPPIKGANIKQDVAAFAVEHLAQQLELKGIRVTTPAQINTLLSFERQKNLLGCTDEASSCVAEISNALGVDGIVLLSLGRFGDTYQVNVRVLSARDGSAVASYSHAVDGDRALLDELSRAADAVAEQLKTTLRKSPAPAKPPEVARKEVPAPADAPRVATPVAPTPRPTSPPEEVAVTAPSPSGPAAYAWIPLSGGVVLGVAAGVLLSQASERYGRLTEHANDVDFLQARAASQEGQQLQVIGGVFAAGAAACLVAGGIMFFTPQGAPASPQVSVLAGPSGGAVVLQGRLP